MRARVEIRCPGLFGRRSLDVNQLRRESLLRKIPIALIEQPEAQCEEDVCLDDLDKGADASICWVGYHDMVARPRALVRREALLVTMAERHGVGNLHVNAVRHEATVDGRPVELDVPIHSLRCKIEPDPAKPTYVATVGGGYKLCQL